MEVSNAELMAHPLMKQVTADIAATRQAQQTQRMLDQMEAARLRAEQGRVIQAEFDAAVAEYEQLRKQTHAATGRIWKAAQDYSRLTYLDNPRMPVGTPPQGFWEAVFMEINLPTLKVDSMRLAGTTTYAAVQGWYATQGKEWVGQ